VQSFGVIFSALQSFDVTFRALIHRFDALIHRFDALIHRFDALIHRFDALKSLYCALPLEFGSATSSVVALWFGACLVQ
jgi:hypothetical protein